MKKIKSFICIMLSGLLFVSSFSGFGMPVQATENATTDIPKYSHIDEYEVIISNSEVLSVLNAQEVAFKEGDKYYMSYTVETLSTTNTGTTFRSGIQTATAAGKREKSPYTTGVLQYYDKTSISESMVEPGYSYTICVEVTANGNTYSMVKSDGTSVSSFKGVVANTAEQKYFGLCVYPGNISGKLTNVKCYDAAGNDLGVWGNTIYGVTAFEEATEYEVLINNTTPMSVLNAKELAFTTGDKYYMSYTVESLSGPTANAFITAIQTTSESGKSTKSPYTSGQAKLHRSSTGISGSMIQAGYSYTLCLEVVGEKSYTCTIIRSDGTSVTLTEASADYRTADKYFGLCAWGGAVTGKFTNVKCYDNKGNDLGVWGNTTYGVTAFEEVTEYEVVINNTAPMSVLNAKELAFTTGDKYYMSYTVESLSGPTTEAFVTAIQTTSASGKSTQSPYASGQAKLHRSSTGISGSMIQAGYSYTLCLEVVGEKSYTCTIIRSDGTSVTLTEASADYRTADKYFGLCTWGGAVTGKFTNVKCYDNKGNDLGIWGNINYGVTVSKEAAEYDVNIKNSSMVFISNSEAIDPTINNEYYLTYTVEGINSTDETLRSGFTTSTDRTAGTPYTSGVFRFVDAKGNSKNLVTDSIVAPGYTYTIYMKVWNGARTYKVTRSDGLSTVDVTPTSNGSNVDTGSNKFYFGLNMWPASITAKLTNVKCYDAAGNDLGVWGNTTYGVSVRSAVDGKNVELYDVYTYDAGNGFVGNDIEVPFTSGDKYYMSYVVEDATSEAGGGIIATTDKTQQYPYLKEYGGMWLNQTTQGVLLDEGASYDICVTITDNKMQYDVMKVKDGAATSLTFGTEIGDVAITGKYYGIWIHGASISKLTDVKCYDATGKDLGVYGNTTYNIQSVWKETKIDTRDQTDVFYDLNEGPYLVTGHNVKAKCVEGQDLGMVTEDGTGLELNAPGTYVITRQEAGGFYEQQVCLYQLGDVNLDGTVTTDDVAALTNLLQSQGQEVVTQNAVQMAADLDNDNTVGTFDLELLTQVTSATDSATELKNIRSKYHVVALTYDYLGGDEVMPIAGYYGPYAFDGKDFLTDEVFSLMKKAGVNLVNHSINVCAGGEQYQQTKALVRKALAAAEQHGVGYFIDDSRLNTNVDITQNKVLTTDESLDALNTPLSSGQIANYLGDYSFYNSYLGTHLIDEPFARVNSDNEKYKYIGFYTDIANSLNQYSNMNGFMNLLGSSQTQYIGNDYAAFIDNYIKDYNPQVLSFDVYPFANKTEGAYSDERMQTYFHSLNVMRNVSDEVPFWAYVQAGGDYRSETGDNGAETNDALLPDKAETLWNVNTALAYGAKGIEWFPLIQPEYFAKEGEGYDYDRNGLIGADKGETPFLAWATQANEQIKAIDEILMKACNTGVLAVGEETSNVKQYTGTNAVAVENIQTITEHLTNVDAGNETWGALVGCFDYRDTESYYVVNIDTTQEQKITLTLDGNYDYRLIQNAVSTYVTTDANNQIILTIPAGEAALVVLEDRTVSYDIADYRSGETMIAPDAEPGYVFAGWFTDETCHTAISKDTKTGNAVAKFVSDELMTTKAQISVAATDTEKRHIRFVSTIDGFKYQAVGFEIMYGNKTYRNELKYAYKTLSATDVEGQKTYNPTDIGGAQAYRFIVDGVKNVPEQYFDLEFHVRPYWITLDGTTVYGDVVVKTVNQGLQLQ